MFFRVVFQCIDLMPSRGVEIFLAPGIHSQLNQQEYHIHILRKSAKIMLTTNDSRG